VRLAASRPRDPTHPEVVRAVHRILTDLGLESDFEPVAAVPREELR
jgi:hypothetical protein